MDKTFPCAKIQYVSLVFTFIFTHMSAYIDNTIRLFH